MAQPGGPKRSVPNVYPAKRQCECDRPLPSHGACVKCGHELPGMVRTDLGEEALSYARGWQEMVTDQSLSKDVRLRAAECSNAVRQELRP